MLYSSSLWLQKTQFHNSCNCQVHFSHTLGQGFLEHVAFPILTGSLSLPTLTLSAFYIVPSGGECIGNSTVEHPFSQGENKAHASLQREQDRWHLHPRMMMVMMMVMAMVVIILLLMGTANIC